MSVADVTTAIADIRSRLAALSTTAGASDGGAAFATALSGVASTSSTSSTSATSATSGGATGDDVVKAALQYKGVPYVLGGESKSGIDCSGLVQASFKDLGIAVPRLVHEQQTIGQKVDSLKDAKPGDLVVLNGGNHIAIWAGNDTVIHAPYPGRSVSVQKAWFDDADVVTIRRVVPASSDAATAATTASATAGTTATSDSGLSTAALGRAVALLGMYGASSSSDGSSSSGDSITSLLSSLTGSSGSSASSSTAQQLLAARTALMGASS